MIDPQAQTVMDTLARQGVASISQVGPEQARLAYLQRKSLTQPPPVAVGEVRDLEISDSAGNRIPARLYHPRQTHSTPYGLTVFFHGGGFVIGSIETHDTLCRSLCEQSGHAVLSVDYRLAPEHPFPAAFDDCLTVTRWAQAQAAFLGIDPARMAVAGDSAGGQLAAVVAQAWRTHTGPALKLQVLMYPITDATMSQPSIARLGTGYMLTQASLRCYYDCYWPEPQDRQDWRSSPLLAKDLSNLAPAFILTAGFDPLRDEGLAYADRLSRSGVVTQFLCFERQMHGFIPMGAKIDEANLAVQICAHALARALAPED